ncbi:BCCT family transporter, partial [Nocardioides kribbensis]|uniref:BCCT family transporter n=1 Tax=Nocardioides kribbensis TaxID=305517 RepID=UPI0032DB6349
TTEPRRPTVVFWGVATGAVAAVMLLVGGDDALTGLHTITIVAALPFVVVMIGLAVSLVKDLSTDPLVVRRQYAVEAVESAVVAGVTEHGDDFVLSTEKDPEKDPDAAPDPAPRTASGTVADPARTPGA